ncbi:MAG: Uma2 family endonuclease [Anaerolineae bacterium]
MSAAARVGAETRWTTSDLDMFPDDGNRYEIIDGELYVSKQPHFHHQTTCNRVALALTAWSDSAKLGLTIPAPGIIFDVDDAVAPDVVWISREQYARAIQPDGKLHLAPELAVEVLSFGGRNEERDKALKLDLYSRRGVREYWVIDWRVRRVDVYRRHEAALRQIATLYAEDTLTSPLLPGFASPVAAFFADIPEGAGE